MRVYLVGGWVRDTLLGLKPKDADFVVVGCSPQVMLDKGFKEVGKDFPIFLHPVTGDEYALARVERNVSQGYKGFECTWEGVTLEDDLARRDLTINSMAMEVEGYLGTSFNIIGDLVDPFQGQTDLWNKCLRETTDAFKEDPVRVLRVARFLARYPEFKTAPSLVNLCEGMEVSGELESLVPERVWLETEKALKEKYPQKYFEFLVEYEFPFMKHFRDMVLTVENNLYHQEDNVFIHSMMVLGHASENWNDSEINFAALLHDINKPDCYKQYGSGHGHDKAGVPQIEEFCKQWKVPNNYRDIAKIVCEQHQRIHTVMGRDQNSWSRPKSVMSIFEQSGAERNVERFLKVLKACESDAKGRIGLSANDDYLQRPYLEDCLYAVTSLDKKSISRKLLENGKSGEIIGLEIRAAKISAIRKVQNEWKNKL